MNDPILPQSNKPLRVRICNCGKEFQVQTRGQRSCTACIEARAAAKAAIPPKRCCDCGVVLEVRIYDRCEKCREVLEAKKANPVRRQHVVEKYIHALMLRHDLVPHTPTWAERSSKNRNQIEREIAKKEEQIERNEHCDYYKFIAKLVIVAWREGILTEERWGKMCELQFNWEEWRTEFEAVCSEVIGREFHIHESERIKLMPWLDAKFNNPSLPVKAEAKAAPQLTAHKSKNSEFDSQFNKLTDAFSMVFYLKATPERQAKMRASWKRDGRNDLLEVVGYAEEEIEVEQVNPEQIGADDQDRIDAVAAELLSSIDW